MTYLPIIIYVIPPIASQCARRKYCEKTSHKKKNLAHSVLFQVILEKLHSYIDLYIGYVETVAIYPDKRSIL